MSQGAAVRREFSKSTKRDAFVRANGHCELCGARLTVGKFAYDHRIPDGLGGEPTLENCQVACSPCHAEKTGKQDIPAIAKTKRIQDRERGIFKATTLKSRGFDKSPPQRRASAPIKKWRGIDEASR